jgi:glycine cleavage system H protein
MTVPAEVLLPGEAERVPAEVLLPGEAERVPSHLRYHSRHTWLDQAGDTVTVGLTQHAADGLGAIVYVQLPEIGDRVTGGDPCGAVESHKTASDVDSPASGDVLTVNDALRDDPGLVNRDPYGAGWLFQLRITELAATLTPEQYQELALVPFPETAC